MKKSGTAIPRLPGVYLMKDAQGRIIYVGKATNLRSRIRSYYSGHDNRPMTPFLMARTSQVDFIATSTAKEALILENNLIKKYRPRYNVVLRDDKTYYHLCLNPSEKFPRLQLVRKRVNNAAWYFGPYPSSAAAKETLRFVQKIFPLRSCRNRDFRLRARPCLEYQIGQCLAPCQGRIEEKSYEKLVEGAATFLRGQRHNLIEDLRRQMEEAADHLNFEEAARLRDRMAAIQHVLERQHVDLIDQHECDVLGIYAQDDVYVPCILFFRDGKLVGSQSFQPLKTKADLSEVASSVLQQYYAEADMPKEIILPCKLPDEKVLQEWLSEKKGKKIRLVYPRKGEKKALLEMACANARERFAASIHRQEQKTAVLEMLKEKLGLTRLPHRIECFDISNVGGKSAVGAMVVFQDGEPVKADYRRFRIKRTAEPDDYGMMREVLSRRFGQATVMPDLVIVDGGKGQLHVALSVLRDLNLKADVIALAKEERNIFSTKERRKKEGKKSDRLYLTRRKDPVLLTALPAVLAFLQRVRDEAHRFAVTYHRKLRDRDELKSVLDEIPDLGPQRKKMLLAHFGSVEGIRKASQDELRNIKGIGKDLAQKIWLCLQAESK